MTKAQLTCILRFLKSARVAAESACGAARSANDDATGGRLAELVRQINLEITHIETLRLGAEGEAS